MRDSAIYNAITFFLNKSIRIGVMLALVISSIGVGSIQAHGDKLSAETNIKNVILDVTCPPDFTAQCNSPEAATPFTLAEFEAVGGSVSSNCNQGFINYKIEETSSGGCPEVITRTIIVVDACGDEATCTYTMTIEANQEPPIITCPVDITVNCAGDVPVADIASVEASALCGTVNVTFMGDDTSNLGSCPGIVIRRYMAEDLCGNVSTCVQTITVNNNCGPNAPCGSICDLDVPSFGVNLTGSADGSWNSPEVVSNGRCCSQSGNPAEMCVHFVVTLASDAVAIQVDILSGVTSTDGLMFQSGCSDFYPIGEVVCLQGGQTLDLMFCKPSNMPYVFNITSYSASSLPDMNQDGVPDVCMPVCENLNLSYSGCAVVYPGYAPAECTEITATPKSGTAPFTYVWMTLDTTKELVVCPIIDRIYTVTVTDANGCSSIALIEVFAVNVRCNGGVGVQMCISSNGGAFPTTQCIEEREVEVFLALGDVLGGCRLNPCGNSGGPILQKDTSKKTIVLDPDHFSPKPYVRYDDGRDDYIFPNPVHDEMTIHFQIPASQTVIFDIFNAQGKYINSGKYEATTGINSYQFSTADFAAGMYFLRYGYQGEIKSLRFIKVE